MSSRREQKERVRAEREARERAAARAERRGRQIRQVGAVATLAIGVVVVLIAVSQGGKDPANASSGGAVTGAALSREMLAGIPQDGTSLGQPDAPYVLTEFADLQCPFCRQYASDVLPHVIETYVRTGQVRLQLRMRGFLGADSDTAARAAYSAAARDRMWNFADLFYRNQGTENSGYVTPGFLTRIAGAAGVPAQTVLDGSRSAAMERPVATAERAAQSAGLTSTPSFLIRAKGGKDAPLNVSQLDFATFRAALEPHLEP